MKPDAEKSFYRDTGANIILTACYAEEGKHILALQHAEAVLQAEKENGYTKIELENTTHIRDSIQAVIDGRTWPEDLILGPAVTHLNIGITFLKAEKYEEAITSFEATQETHGQPSGYIQTLIGSAYSALGHHEEAIKHYDNAIKIRDTPLHRAMRGIGYAIHGRCAEATADAETALSMDPYSKPRYHTSAEAHWILAACLEDEQTQLHMDQALAIAQAHEYTEEEINLRLEVVEIRRTLKKISQPTTTDDEARIIPNPAQRHLELKQLMLRQTNQHRAEAGAPPVRMGTNPAAQIHAEEALKGCYTAHWDRWGMKPNHRYTLTSGTGADGENASGISYCVRPNDNYAPNDPMETEVTKTMQGWMDSPGHSRNLLNPAHTVLNIGIAWDKYKTNMVQQFSSDYVYYQVRPTISTDGILKLSGQVSGATLQIDDSVNIQIRWDPPLKPLTQGQLANTYALCNPRQVGYVVEPLPPNWSLHRTRDPNQDPGTSLRGPLQDQPQPADYGKLGRSSPGLGRCQAGQLGRTPHNR